MPNWKALTKKLTSGMPKMSKSHDRPVCAYLMSMQDHDPSDIFTKNFLNPLKRMRFIIRTSTDGVG